MSLLMQHQKLARIDNSDDPFAVPEPEKKKPRQAKARAKSKSGGKSKLSRPVLIGAGAAGVLAVLLGVVFIFKNDKGEEVRGGLHLPPGGSSRSAGRAGSRQRRAAWPSGSGQRAARPPL